MSQVLGLREVHKPGATRVCADGAHVLTGGSDGVVALFRRKGWPTSTAVWARQCHDAAVTCVVLHDALQLALTCGRDGRVLLHENVSASAAGEASQTESVLGVPQTGSATLTTRAVCKLTGEVRCLAFDAANKRLFIGGDSLRSLEMGATGFDVITYALRVPHPIVSLALSPCCRWLAVGSGTNGAVQVTPVRTAVGDASTSDATLESPTSADVVLPGLLSTRYTHDEDATCRMDWCRTAGGLFLLVPTAVNTRVFVVVESTATTTPTMSLKPVAVLHGGEDMIHYTSVSAYPLTAHRFACVMASRTGVVVAKVDDRKFAMTRCHAQSFPSGHGGDSAVGGGHLTAITDLHVHRASGDVVVALRDGQVSVLARLAPKQGTITASPSKSKSKSATAAATDEEAELADGNPKTTRNRSRSRSVSSRSNNTSSRSSSRSSSSRRSGSGGGSRSSSSSGGSRRSGSADEDEAEEDLPRVVEDLKRTNADFIGDGDDTDRPSRWRDEDPRKVLKETERRQSTSARASRFLDDEADEASSSSSASADGDDRDIDEEQAYLAAEAGDAEEDGFDGDDEEAINEVDVAHLSPAGAATCALVDYSFQVGATPVGEEGSCYLAYNAVGYIHSARESTTVHFHDISQPAVRIMERGTILMGTLSPVGAGFIVATDPANHAHESQSHQRRPGYPQAPAVPESVDDQGSLTAEEQQDATNTAPRLTVYYRTFVALGAQADWRVRLQPGETVRCLAAGLRFLAVATNRYLRLYSLSGLELGVLSKYSRIVTMVGTTSSKLMNAYKAEVDVLAVVFALGTGDLYVEVLDVGSRTTLMAAHPLPLTEWQDEPGVARSRRGHPPPHHQLQWLGWSEDGPLHTVDTAGVVRMYTESWGGSWVPVYDPRTTLDQSDNYWVWGVNDEKLFAYRSSKNDPPYPAASATGLPTAHVSLFLPLTRGISSARDRDLTTWDHLLRRQIRTDELKRQSRFYTAAIAKHDALHDKKVLELFATALKAQQTTRALDLATTLELRDNVEVCARMANTEGHAQLVRKLLALYELRVKAKSKRRCSLPLEGSLVSERERDVLLRKLLLKEKQSATTESAPTESQPVAVNKPDKAEKVEKIEKVESTAAPAPPPRRHVTFNIPSTTAAVVNNSSTTASAAVTRVDNDTSKPVNPFAKPVNPFAKKPEMDKPTAPTPPPHTQTTLTHTPERPPRSVLLPNSTHHTTSAQQQPTSSPSPIKSPAAAAALSTHSHEASSHSPSPAADKESGTHRSPTRSSGSSTTASSTVDDALKPARRTTFVAKALPAAAVAPTSSLSPAKAADTRYNSRDPFMNEDVTDGRTHTGEDEVEYVPARGGLPTSEHGTHTSLTVDQLLQQDRQAETATTTQTESFGEALRKRFREEQAVEDEEDVLGHAVLLPPTLMPKVE